MSWSKNGPFQEEFALPESAPGYYTNTHFLRGANGDQKKKKNFNFKCTIPYIVQ